MSNTSNNQAFPQALTAACTDSTVDGTSLVVLARCHAKWLEPQTYRALGLRTVSQWCNIKPATASKSLGLLLAGKYLERGRDTARGLRTYRLLSRAGQWVPPSIVDACDDTMMMLSNFDFELLIRCWGQWLEPHHYATLSATTIAKRCRVRESNASRTLAWLVDAGYLERGLDGSRGVHTFRVLPTLARRKY